MMIFLFYSVGYFPFQKSFVKSKLLSSMVGEYFHSQFAYGETDMKRRTVQDFQKCLVFGGRHYPRFSEVLII